MLTEPDFWFQSQRGLVSDIERLFGEIAVGAGLPIMQVYANGTASALKSDGSPVTEADMRAEAFILEQLERYCGGTPVIAEESMAAGQKAAIAERFILVDPLDGTKEFIDRRDEFTVNIALIESGQPVAGAIYAPALNTLWIGGTRGARSATLDPGQMLSSAQDERPIHARPWPGPQAIGVASRNHSDEETERFLSALAVGERRSRGSSLKFCLLAAAEADVYPRFGPTMEWDVAAGHAILNAAGGTVTKPDGTPFTYGKINEGFRNGPFIGWGDKSKAYQSKS
jgi:3'(2'), 5'-bisphosphate nucleotidase